VALDLKQVLRNEAGGKSADEDAAGPITARTGEDSKPLQGQPS
jgi:hypothetical protein